MHVLLLFSKEIKLPFSSRKEAGRKNIVGNRRDSSKGRYRLTEPSGNSKLHLNDNIKASWLLKELADRTSSLSTVLDQDQPLNMRLGEC